MRGKIIAAIRSEEELTEALRAPVEWVFDLAPNIFTLKKVVTNAHQAGKKLMIHLDLAEGIEKDKFGIAFCKQVGVDGIISTRGNVIKMAKELELFTVQRFFLMDSQSVQTTVEALKRSKTDMAEIMPGVVPKLLYQLRQEISVPLIAGGLIETRQEVAAALQNGAVAVSTGKAQLWREKV